MTEAASIVKDDVWKEIMETSCWYYSPAVAGAGRLLAMQEKGDLFFRCLARLEHDREKKAMDLFDAYYRSIGIVATGDPDDSDSYAERDDDLMRYLFKERVLKTASSTLNEASLQLFCDLLFLWLADGDRDKTEVWVTDKD